MDPLRGGGRLPRRGCTTRGKGQDAEQHEPEHRRDEHTGENVGRFADPKGFAGGNATQSDRLVPRSSRCGASARPEQACCRKTAEARGCPDEEKDDGPTIHQMMGGSSSTE